MADQLDCRPEPQRISLSLTASYAPSWKIWEGLRELVQNWHDGLLSADLASKAAGVTPSTATASLEFSSKPAADATTSRFAATRAGQEVGWCEYIPAEDKLVMVNRGVGLGRQVLLLGYSKKAQHHDVIGSFGEGMKVGAVALLRRGLRLRIFTKSEVWTFELAVDPNFGERVLTVETARRPEVLDVELEGLPSSLANMSVADTTTVLEGIKPQEWRELSQRFLFLKPPQESVRTEVGRLLLDPTHAGSFFVRGVWINDDPDLSAGVDLFDIRLDRDRAAVLKKSDMQHQVSSMWLRAIYHCPSLQGRYYQLLADERQCSDIAFADLYCDEDAAAAMAALFRQQHGDAIPVSLKGSNSAKAQQLRNTLSASTVVCNQALLAVLKKGGMKCDLECLLQEGHQKARRFVPLADLSEDEASALAHACKLAQLADPAVGCMLQVDIVESPREWALGSVVERAEAFESTGRLEVDRRALNLSRMQALVGNWCAESGVSAECRCRESFLACAMLDVRSAGRSDAPKFTRERLVAHLARESSAERLLLRCPDLGRDREEALRQQITALEATLGAERTAHADELKALRRRVGEAEKELLQTEFKIMDATDAERKLREQLEPELAKLRAQGTELADAREAARAGQEKADAHAREVVYLRQQLKSTETSLADVEDAAARRIETAESSSKTLRRALAQRRQLLQKMVHEDLMAPLVSLVDNNELQLAVEEIREALRTEVTAKQCCVCMHAAVNVVLLPCRHQQLCATCADAVPSCPVCRSHISDRMRVYS